MKKYLNLLIAAAVVLGAASCEREPLVPEDNAPKDQTVSSLVNPITVTFSASANSKVSLEGDTAGLQTAVWDENDQVKIVWYNGEMKSALATVDSYGNVNTTFTAQVEDAEFYYAVYPSTLSVTLDENGAFNVRFPNNANAFTSFSEAAWYAAKTNRTDKSFAFHPISTVIQFTLDGTAVPNPEEVYFRTVAGGITKMYGDCPLTFADTDGYPVTVGVPSEGGAANVSVKVPGHNPGTYFLVLAATNETAAAGGFVFQIRKSGESIPAAHYSATVSSIPGKLYRVSSAVDSKVIRDYYVSLSTKGSGGGLSAENADTFANLKANVPAFKYGTYIAGSLLLDGATINILGDATPYTEPLSPFNTNNSSGDHSYTIKGGIGGTTTFTTSSTSSFNSSKAHITLKDITFSNCSTTAATVSAGTVDFDSVVFSNNNRAVTASGGLLRFNSCTFSDNTFDGEGGAAIYAGTTSKATIWLNACRFENNAGTKNGIAIYCNTSNGTDLATLCINNSYFYHAATLNAKSSNAALITNKGKSILLNSTLVATVGANAWGVWALGCHKNYSDADGCLLINSIVKNKASAYQTSVYETGGNYYAHINHCLTTVAHSSSSGYESQITQTNVASEKSLTLTDYTWNGNVPAGFTQQSASSILAELSGETASGFVDWLESIKYNVGGNEYNALQVDIRGVPRTESAYWPGCYQND